MLSLGPQQEFIYSEVTILAWGASVQRAKLYNPDIPLEDRDSDSFRASRVDNGAALSTDTRSVVGNRCASCPPCVAHSPSVS